MGRQTYSPFGVPRTTSGNLQTDFTLTGQKIDWSDGLMYYGARYYDAQLGRFTPALHRAQCGASVSADTIVPNAGNPQSLNRYAYALNNPLRYIDPRGHSSCGLDGGGCKADDEGGGDNPTRPLGQDPIQGLIGKIHEQYPNVNINPTNWVMDELQAFWDGLNQHPFIADIRTASSITVSRLHGDSLGGGVNKTGEGIYDIAIFDIAYYIPPDAEDSKITFKDKSIIYFEGVIIHEFTHVATGQNSRIIDSYINENTKFHFFTVDLGSGYNFNVCEGGAVCQANEYVAISAATWEMTPRSFDTDFLFFHFEDWRKAWVGQWSMKPQ